MFVSYISCCKFLSLANPPWQPPPGYYPSNTDATYQGSYVPSYGSVHSTAIIVPEIILIGGCPACRVYIDFFCYLNVNIFVYTCYKVKELIFNPHITGRCDGRWLYMFWPIVCDSLFSHWNYLLYAAKDKTLFELWSLFWLTNCKSKNILLQRTPLYLNLYLKQKRDVEKINIMNNKYLIYIY